MGMGEEHAVGGAVATDAPEDGLLCDERAAASASEGSAQVRGGAAGAPEAALCGASGCSAWGTS